MKTIQEIMAQLGIRRGEGRLQVMLRRPGAVISETLDGLKLLTFRDIQVTSKEPGWRLAYYLVT